MKKIHEAKHGKRYMRAESVQLVVFVFISNNYEFLYTIKDDEEKLQNIIIIYRIPLCTNKTEIEKVREPKMTLGITTNI